MSAVLMKEHTGFFVACTEPRCEFNFIHWLGHIISLALSLDLLKTDALPHAFILHFYFFFLILRSLSTFADFFDSLNKWVEAG